MRSAFEKDKERFYKAFKLMVELTNKMQDKEKADEVFEICLKYLLDTNVITPYGDWRRMKEMVK